MKKITTLLLICFTALCSQSQTLDSSILSSYSKSVVARVYDVATKTTLSTAQQQSLADLFTDEEDDLYSLATGNAPQQNIDSVKNYYRQQLHILLGATKTYEYYRGIVGTKANATARLTAAMLRRKYNVDATMQQYFQNIINWRENFMESTWLKETNVNTRDTALAGGIYVYDSLLGVYTNVSASSQYFGNRLYYLDSIKPIDSNTKKNLAEKYYNAVIQHPYKSYSDIFNNTFNDIFHQLADTPYYFFLYKNEIYQTSLNNTTNAVANYISRDKISLTIAQQITPLVLQRERLTALLNKVYPVYTQAKDSIINTLTYVYQSQINNLIAGGSTLINPSQIDLAIYYAPQLNLNNEQLENLQTALQTLISNRSAFKEANPMVEYDSKAYESNVLNNILTAEQYTQVLTTKYYNTATNMAGRIWYELDKANLRKDLVETDTKTELTNYYLAIIIAHYRNANSAELQYSTVASIRELMPTYLRTLINHWEYSIPYSDTPDTFFQW